MTNGHTITDINIFRDCGGSAPVWCYAAWVGAEYDHGDTLGEADTEQDARNEVSAYFPRATIRRVDDVRT